MERRAQIENQALRNELATSQEKLEASSRAQNELHDRVRKVDYASQLLQHPIDCLNPSIYQCAVRSLCGHS